jgi:hypothetical protein
MPHKNSRKVGQVPPFEGWCSFDGTRQSGPVSRREAPAFDEGRLAELHELREQILQLVGPEDFEALLEVAGDGVALSKIARDKGEHRGTTSRRFARLKDRARPALLAVVARRLLDAGADGFTLCPHSGAPLRGVDAWCVCVGGERRYPDAPSLEELRDFIAGTKARLFGEDETYLGCWNEQPGDWILELTTLHAPLAAALAAGHANNQTAIYHLGRGELVPLSPPPRQAA